MGIKYLTLGTLSPINKESISVSYALEISQVQNIKNLLSLIIESFHTYMRVAASHTTNNGQYDHVSCTPRRRQTFPYSQKTPIPHVQLGRRKEGGSPAHDSFPKSYRRLFLFRGLPIQKPHVGKTLAGYKRGSPLPVLPRMGRPLPVLPRIRPRLPRGTQQVTHDGMPRQTSTSTRAKRVSGGDMPSQ